MAGVYISYPFCSQKCSFCNFASGVSSPEMIARYTAALLSEMENHAWNWAPETLYLGGGTPSLMPDSLLRQFLHAVPSAALTETTMECAPGTAQPTWAATGVNRVSLGVQSFVPGELKQTGRRHTPELVANEVASLRQSGIDNLNIDLIAGLPGQTRNSWEQSLDWIERLSPPHVSVYIFEIDEDSRLGKEALLGGIRYGANILPSDDLTAELYELAVARLTAFGLPRYEISNFARPGFESLHNLKYWKLEPYVGFGLDAHSFDGTRRWSNPDELEQYLKCRQHIPISTDYAEEHFFVGLRLSSGIAPSAEERVRFAAPIARWKSAGMLEETDGRLRLSDRGVLVSNEVLQEFVGG